MAKKITQNSTEDDLVAKKESARYLPEEYRSMADFKMHPVSTRFLNELAKRLVAWADKDTSLVLSAFYCEEKLRQSTFARWAETHENLQMARDYAKLKLGGRLMEGGLKREFSEGLVKHILPLYDDEIKSLETWRSKLGEKIDASAQVTVIMQRFPDSPKVKPSPQVTRTPETE